MSDLPSPNGAEALIGTMVRCGVDVCFGNPGTSEMYVVAALDAIPRMRGVLVLFEGVATGAADGYGRMADKPAATLLHVGNGLSNGVAHLHNARRAQAPVVVLVGDNPVYHKPLDPPHESDIDAMAGVVSGWQHRIATAAEAGADVAEAVAAAGGPPGQVATLIVPADVSWSEGGRVADPVAPRPRTPVSAETLAEVAAVLRSGEPSVLLIGGLANRAEGVLAASRIAVATGATLLGETFPARARCGAGLPAVSRLGYFSDRISEQLAGAKRLILAGARAPIARYARPGKPIVLTPEGCRVHTLADDGADDVLTALTRLADLVAPDTEPVREPARIPRLPTGPLTPQNWGDVVAALLPENAIICEEANTSGEWLHTATAGASQHDLLTNCGGPIGLAMPQAVGAAIACPDRPVLCLEADGSAMYTLPALWTHARENLNITTIILNNRAYAVLQMQLPPGRTQQDGSRRSADLLDLSRPDLDFVRMATGMGVSASRATTGEELANQLRNALAEPGPHLIEVVIPSLA